MACDEVSESPVTCLDQGAEALTFSNQDIRQLPIIAFAMQDRNRKIEAFAKATSNIRLVKRQMPLVMLPTRFLTFCATISSNFAS